MTTTLGKTERKERRRRMAFFVANGGSLAKAAEKFGVSRQTVWKACTENNVIMHRPKATLRPTYPGVSREDRRKRRSDVAAFIQGGGSLTDACRKFGMATEAVTRCCIEFGVDPPTLCRGSERVLRVIADLINTAETHSVIAQRHGISGSAVSEISAKASAAGIPLKRRQP